MKKRKRRLDKKIHKRIIDYCIVDLGYMSYYLRNRLFDANYGDEFLIDSEHLEGIPESIAKIIKNDNLHFLVSKVRNEETESWLSEGGLVIFKFWARDYPSVKKFTGNNPHDR